MAIQPLQTMIERRQCEPAVPVDTAHGLPRHYVPRKDDFICVTASEARQSMPSEVMDCFTLGLLHFVRNDDVSRFKLMPEFIPPA